MDFSSIYRAVTEGIAVLDQKGNVLYLNEAAEKIFDIKASEGLERKLIEQALTQSENDAFLDAILDVIYSEDQSLTRTVQYKSRSRLYTLYISSIHVNTGEFRGIILVFSDITALDNMKKTEQQLEHKRVRSKALEEQNEILTKAFQNYLDDDVVKELLNSPTGINGNLTNAEMSLFMLMSPRVQGLIAEMDAAAYLDMLNHYYDCMISMIKEQNGTIFELHSDEILAGFGSPKKLLDHTDAAFLAADRIQKSMDEINAWNLKKGYPEIAVQIGIHRDVFPVGVIGGKSVSKYNVFGKNINFTARIAITAKDGDIVITDNTREALKVPYEVYEQYAVVPKGISEPVTIYKVRGIEKDGRE